MLRVGAWIGRLNLWRGAKETPSACRCRCRARTAPYTPDQKFWDMYADDIALPETYYQDPSDVRRISATCTRGFSVLGKGRNGRRARGGAQHLARLSGAA